MNKPTRNRQKYYQCIQGTFTTHKIMNKPTRNWQKYYQCIQGTFTTHKIMNKPTRNRHKYYQCIQGTFTTHKIMNKLTWNRHPLFKIANNALVDLPTPSTLRGWWNCGSVLGICLVAQIVTGLFLAIHNCPNVNHSISQSKTHLSRCKLWMTSTNTPRKWSLINCSVCRLW
jgi:hypothetical protein